METRQFYRVANSITQQGLWYNFSGMFTGLIHNKFSFCKNNKLAMPFDKNLVGFLSATETLDELFQWFTPEDIKKLEKFGYSICLYEPNDYKFHHNHWIIKQNSCKLIKNIYLISKSASNV